MCPLQQSQPLLVPEPAAQVDTIRLRLLKIAAQVQISARRIRLRYSSAYPWKPLFAHASDALRC